MGGRKERQGGMGGVSRGKSSGHREEFAKMPRHGSLQAFRVRTVSGKERKKLFLGF